jgi:hypothetical protein
VLYVIYAEDIADSLEKRLSVRPPIWRVCNYYMMKVACLPPAQCLPLTVTNRAQQGSAAQR